MNLNITQILIPASNRNRPGRVNPANFITIHETGNTRPGANARAHAGFLNNPNTAVSYHYSVDDAEIVQHLPETEDAFHAGDGAGPGNRQSIGIEICVNSDGDFVKAIDRTVMLVADICARRNIPVENIRQHFHWSGKNCPQNIRAGRPLSWGDFLANVQSAQSAPKKTSGVNLQITNSPDKTGNISDPISLRIPARNENGRWLLDLPTGPEGQPQPNVLLRVVLETLGFDVSWDGDSGTVVAQVREEMRHGID